VRYPFTVLVFLLNAREGNCRPPTSLLWWTERLDPSGSSSVGGLNCRRFPVTGQRSNKLNYVSNLFSFLYRKPKSASSPLPFFLLFFPSWKQHRSGEGGLSRPHSLRRVAVGAKRRALIGLPRSVHSSAEEWEIIRSLGRRVFPAARSFCPPAAASPGIRPPRLSTALRGL
jgi:hypothetical protein